ncbi:MAG: amino acid permease [Gemmatimonadota bacterium]|uniref:APC family permease n=1 Tax=Candidatus Palauibacter scopulicola TaxID=3056741 RepID=UPI00238CD506|nr:amino acid permease [Candidatus Palauibacter scopulicola]MDE2662675.1 amino acid permease [Candidatus Palauibacter scopulicola]
MSTSRARFGLHTAAAVVVANMIGTGVFTSLGFQLESLRSGFALLMLWVVGGVAAVCGALTYAELGSTIRRSGGEYTFLSHIYHPAAGFVSGWISATIGFAAPTALAAITFGTYLSSVFPVLPARWLAVGLVVLLSVVHGRTHRTSGGFQRWSTTAKVVLILAFVAAGLALVAEPRDIGVLPSAEGVSGVFSAGFAVSLIFVSYSYSGWNAATYVTGELRDPRRTLPRALAAGTLLVMLLYVGLNYVFLRAAPAEEMVGRLEVGYIAAGYIFGPVGADLMGITLALLLVSTVSAMVLAGPRVLHAIGEDYPTFRFLSSINARGTPGVAIFTQAAISLLFILTESFETILVFSGFTMGLNTFLAAGGVFLLRRRQASGRAPNRDADGRGGKIDGSEVDGSEADAPYRAWGYPVTPLVFLAVTGWTLAYILRDRPLEAGLGLGLIAVGLAIYAVTRARDRRTRDRRGGT